MSKKSKYLDPEYLEGEIDYSEMVKQDYKKAILIILLTIISAAGLTIAFYFIALYSPL